MATTIRGAFSQFRSNLEITDLQAQTVSTRQTSVRGALEKKLVVLDSFLTGSYIRSTMIAPLGEADIDIIVVLSADYYSAGGQAALLDKVKNVLKETYPRTPSISRNGQAVMITFSDFIVDVVPGFFREGGGYLIPSTTERWIATDPKKHVTISTQQNAYHHGDLVPLVKMIKAWNRTANRHFRSFHLEALAWQILRNVTVSDFPSGVRYFFDKSRSAVRNTTPDPAGYGGDVAYYIYTEQQISSAVSRFETAYKRAHNAEVYAASGKVGEAIGEWRKIFGGDFPSYG